MVAMLAGRPDAAAELRATVAVHTDPEAPYLYGLCQAWVGEGLDALSALAVAGRAEARIAFEAAGGPALLGA